MRPYLAIFKDSLREAVSSRTLPFLLVFFTIFLVVVAPIGLKEEISWKLRGTDIADLRLLAIKLRGEQGREGDNPSKRVLERLPEGLRTRLVDPNGLEGDKAPDQNPFGPTRTQEELAESVNDRVLTDEKFYSEAAWKGRELSDEAKELIKRREDLSEDEQRRMNRLLFDTAYSGAVMPAPKSAVEIKWFGMDLPFFSEVIRDATIDKAEVQRQAQSLIGVFSGWVVGPIGLLIAVFVTSTIIPRMFEAGAIDLLLSKPISRTGLFLAKFFSGCAFVLITFSYLMVGIWLIVGLRLGAWNHGLLLTIPLLLFGFSVIYSVSAVSGVAWRNPIVSVFLAVIVWGASFLVGFTREAVATFRNGDKAREIVFAGQTMLVSDKNGHVHEWSASGGEWREVFKSASSGPPMMGFFYPLVGPVYDPKGDRLIAGDVGPTGSNRLIVGTRSSEWARADGAPLPPATRSLAVTNDGRLLAAGQAGLFRFEGEPTTKAAEWGFWGFNFAPKDAKNAFVRMDGDRKESWTRDAAAAFDRRTGAVVVADKGKLYRFELSGDAYEQKAEQDLKTDKAVLVGLGGGRVVAAFEDGTVRLFDAVTLKEIASHKLAKDDAPRTVDVSRDGSRALVLMHGGRVTIFDAQKGALLEAQVRGEGDISAAAFGPDGSLWAADRLKRLTRYDAKSLDLAETREGRLSTGEMIYRYVLGPLHWILPNTYGLGNAQTYLFTEKKSEAVGGPDARLDSERVTYDVWGPIWQNTAFLVVVLGLTCVYISRKDF